ncbi:MULTISPECIES: TonB-dependent receptor [unclassified Arcicella]|uniref:SusC/RagA family TonB-linked outer membrane protein n=1 Tax=unclassified Arcicella TaxID=2644986 RepID=UPI00285B5D37|nr:MULTISPECIES: TonB-dependent receptor [unclassified Arcicella]MDR6563905.1 TonB-linked SusC/RagA family outer membrane protein [Arcicella sp. BE51]MDR6813658.1 TonB-linked SusC/RagA family outer membrane protein [Arcicella sp. BE140]MDR6824961.1 TonB-linked SusC/RagA family outer membrane protein [Arcicella sp. BE139]
MNTKFYSTWKSMLLSCVFLLSTFLTMAQDRRVTGKVTGADGQGIPGVSVLLKGTQTGVSTDANGSFAINLKSGKDVLLISAIGYKSTEVKVGTQSNVDVKLAEDVSALDEVIVTGYSSSSKRESTGSVSTIKAKDLVAVPSGNVEQQLQGRASGVTVISSGQPGAASLVRIHGFGSFGDNNPLYIVDGVPVQSTDFLAPGDIETTTILKDAAAASIYGARAANGVIVYTTKKGAKKARALEVTYDGLYGVTDPGKGQAMLNPQEQADWTWNAIRNTAIADGTTPNYGHPQYGTGTTAVLPDYINVGGRSGVIGTVDLAAEKAKYNVDPNAGAIYQVVKANKAGTDWYGAITRMAPISRHNLGFSGGTEHGRYYFGLSAQEQAGILIYNQFKRYTFRANSEFDLSKHVRIGENLQFTYKSVLAQDNNDLLNPNRSGVNTVAGEGDVLSAFRMPPIIPVYDEFGGYAGTAAKGFNNPRNPVASRDGSKNDKSYTANGFGNIYLEIEPIPNLLLKTSIGGQYTNAYSYSYSRLQYENSENNASFGYNEFSGYQFGWTFTNTINYFKQLGDHKIKLLGGYEALNTGFGRGISASGINPFSTDLDYITMTTVSATGKIVNSYINSGVTFSSMFGQLDYSFNDKYYFTGVVRRDGSSRFGINSRYGVFPAFSGAWRISKEDFMRDLPWISDLKIKGGWGQMGNSNPVDPNNQYSLFASNVGNSFYDINGSNTSAVSGFYKSRIGNPNAKWETNTTINVGFESSLLKGKWDLAVDFWQRKTTDALFSVPLPGVLGTYAAAPAVNVGTLSNRGIDIQIINRGAIAKDWNYEVTATGSFLDNKITSFAPNISYLTGGTYRGLTPVRNQLDKPMSSFYGYQVLGLFNSKEEVSKSPTQLGAAPGRFRYADVSGPKGVPDGVIDANDRTYLGSPVPTFTGGMTFRVTYKAFDFSTFLAVSLGNKIANVSKWFTDFYPSFTGAAVSARVKNSWTPTNTNTDQPIFEGASNFSTNSEFNSFYVENGSYMRMQNISIGYNIPKNALSKIGLKNARISGSASNIFTITGYKGLDPSIGGAADTNFGIDIGNVPITRSYNIALNLSF